MKRRTILRVVSAIYLCLSAAPIAAVAQEVTPTASNVSAEPKEQADHSIRQPTAKTQKQTESDNKAASEPTGVKGTTPSVVAPSPSSCEIRLLIQSTDPPGAFEAIDRNDGHAGVCVKRKGSGIAIPSGIMLRLANGEDVDTTHRWYGYKRNATPICVETDLPDGPCNCTWSGRIRDKFGIEFKLIQVEGLPLASELQAVQLYVNGKLRFSRTLVHGDSSQLNIPYLAIKDAGLVPFDAAVDLQVIPTSTAVEQGLLAQKPSASDRFQWAIDAAEALVATARSTFPNEAQHIDCLKEHATVVRAALGGLRAGSYLVPNPSGRCPTLATPGDLAMLGAYFDRLENGIASTDATAGTAELVLNRLADWLRNGETAEVQAIIDSLENAGALQAKVATVQIAIADVRNRLQAAHAMIESSQQGIILTAMAARTARRDIKQFLVDSSAQNEAFKNLVAKLEANGGPFQDHQSNPVAPPGAVTLQMRFADVFQLYGFAPWHAVPVRVSGRNQGSEVSVANAIPVLDVIGVRWQWDNSRMADFRLAAGGFYIPDIYTETKSNGEQATHDVFSPGLQLNASLANLHVGAGYVIGRNVEGDTDSWGWNHNRVRLMVGLDLYKLITGENVEVF